MKKSIAKIVTGLLLVVLFVTGCSSTEDAAEGTASAEASATAAESPTSVPPPPPAAPVAPPSTSEAAQPQSVVYEVTGEGVVAGSVTITSMVNGQISQEQATEAPLPFTKELPWKEPGSMSFDSYSIMAQSDGSGGAISCKITIAGKVAAEQTSTGPYSVVSCTS